MSEEVRYNAQDAISGLLPRLDRCIRKGGKVTLTRDECRAIMEVIDSMAARPQEPEKLA